MRCPTIRLACLVIAMIMPCLFWGSLDAASSAQTPEVFVRMTFNVAWSRFCYLAPLFKHRLSDILIEKRDGLVFLIPPSRIKIINFEKECENKHGNIKIAVVDFYISSHVDPSKVDKKYTEHAFVILFHYLEAGRMVLLGPTFELMVDKVEISGKGAHTFPKRLNEGERVGIGIAVGLIIVVTLTVIYILMYHKRKSSKAMKLEVPPNPRRHCKAERNSLNSEGTEDIILDDVVVEGPSGQTGMQLANHLLELRRTGAPRPPDSDDEEDLEEEEEEEEEEELNIFVAKL